MRAKSAKRAAAEAGYRDMSKVVRAETGGICELGPLIRPVDPGHRCIRYQQGLHHLRKTGQGGARGLRANVRGACNPCNEWVEDNPDDARDLGLVVLEGDPEWDDLGARAERLAL